MSTRTYAMRSHDKPDWMIIAPINALTVSQWSAAFAAITLMKDKNNYWLSWTTVENVAKAAGVSKSTARLTLNKLCDMGLFRKERNRIGIGCVYYRKVAV